MRKIKPLILTGAIAFSSLFTINSVAQAEEKYVPLTEQNYKQIEAKTQNTKEYYKYVKGELKKLDVADKKINNLINKLEKGQKWDSLNPSMKGQATKVKIDNNTTKYEYPDGSVYVESLDTSDAKKEVVKSNTANNKGYSAQATIGGGSTSGGSGYQIVKGAKVTGSVILAGASYKVDYQLINGGYDKLSRMYDRNVTVPGSGGNYEIESWGVKKGTENAGGKAYGTLRFKAQNGSLGSSTLYLNTYVGKDKASVSSNM
ncbi:hypothetical protein WKH56_34625 [Priestia sp. SB1]|uniref:hypothetical protein n=1 Tax=Priestia sp. SB1 TaxID=3132359 RepID=UPI003175FD88